MLRPMTTARSSNAKIITETCPLCDGLGTRDGLGVCYECHGKRVIVRPAGDDDIFVTCCVKTTCTHVQVQSPKTGTWMRVPRFGFQTILDTARRADRTGRARFSVRQLQLIASKGEVVERMSHQELLEMDPGE